MAGKTNRKHRRNIERPSDKRYKAEQRWLSNKEKKLTKHLKTHPNDQQSLLRVVPTYTKPKELKHA